MKRRMILLALTLTASAQPAAALAAAPNPLMTLPGAILLSDPLSTVGPAWKAAKGRWAAQDGVLRGEYLAAENHPATFRHEVALRDGVIQFDVRLDTAKAITLSLNDAKGHVARLVLDARGFQARKDDHDHAGPDKAEAFNAVKLPLATDAWHTVTVELLGTRMLASVDGQKDSVSFGQADLIGTQKTNVGLTVSGGAASFRNLGVWAATPNAAWVDPTPVIRVKK
ncbi:hypothetical protein [Deinococcus sp.]|uniref:hypothetical protein n=1 Tax=Deinococcus sp. TaxID=47478 RepID=UPI0028698B0B|nr:hypothetical protein [Deinococcus sp.]